LTQAVARPVIGEIGIGAAIHHFGILGIGHTKPPFITVLEIISAKPRLGVQVPHQASRASIGQTLGF
jgi:hypothetical protein